MIKDKKELTAYLSADSKHYRHANGLPQRLRAYLYATPISDQRYIWQYIKTMRHCEYAIARQHTLLGKIQKLWYGRRLLRLAYKTGFQIPPGVFGKGLTIWHWGTIIINPNARIGENCTLHSDVIIGQRKPNGGSPVIGCNSYICGGGRILGNITIGDNVSIAPNTVVFKNVPSNCVVAGNPAVIIKKDGQKVHIPL